MTRPVSFGWRSNGYCEHEWKLLLGRELTVRMRHGLISRGRLVAFQDDKIFLRAQPGREPQPLDRGSIAEVSPLPTLCLRCPTLELPDQWFGKGRLIDKPADEAGWRALRRQNVVLKIGRSIFAGHVVQVKGPKIQLRFINSAKKNVTIWVMSTDIDEVSYLPG